MYRNRRNRPLTPIGYVAAPVAFWLTCVIRPVFDHFCPEPTKYKYRVADSRTDAEPVAELAQDKHG